MIELSPTTVVVAVAWTSRSDINPNLVTYAERARAATYLRQCDQERSLLGAILLRSVTARILGLAAAEVPIDRTCATCSRQHGAPRVLGTELRVSLTHAGDAVLVACRFGGAVGIDVEPVQSPEWQIADRAIRAPLEPEAANEVEFVDRWVSKEAVLKATGEGLNLDPRRVRLRNRYATLISDTYPALWQVDTIQNVPGYIAKIAYPELPVGRAHILNLKA